MSETVIGSRRFQAGYEVRTRRVDGVDARGGPPFEMKSAYTPDGAYIGSPKDAYRLCKVRGIKPQLSEPDHRVCSIGFSEQEQKWYGWSHRAIYGFGVGDEVREGDCTASEGLIEEYLAMHPEERRALPVGFVAKTLDDARRMAVAFAASVG